MKGRKGDQASRKRLANSNSACDSLTIGLVKGSLAALPGLAALDQPCHG